MRQFFLIVVMWVTVAVCAVARNFVHPGVTYTEADILRIKAMVEAQVEPYYTTWLAYKKSGHLTAEGPKSTDVPETEIPNDDYYNGVIGAPGRRALDAALYYRITGDENYAKKAVAIINFRSYYSTLNCSTAALSCGKVNLLIEAAELMRDYEGWAKADQDRFKTMLRNVFYPKLKDFDRGRWGNQGLFAVRALLAMGVYLDDEIIYSHAYNYILQKPRATGDKDKFPLGAPTRRSEVTSGGGHGAATDEYMRVYNSPTTYGNTEYYYDEALTNYILENGQVEEAARDQGHTMVGTSMYVNIAEICWNQGDDLYGASNNRILLGNEWTFRYNLSPLVGTAWNPTGYTTGTDATFDNGKFIQRMTKSARWYSLKPYDLDRESQQNYFNGLMRECALAHYAVRAGLPEGKYYWLKRSRDYMIEKHGYENWGKTWSTNSEGVANYADNWAYEFPGWGTLTKRREAGMVGDPVVNGEYAMHNAGEDIAFSDIDKYSTGNEDHTQSGVTVAENAITSVKAGGWMLYTVNVEKSGKYTIVSESADMSNLKVTVDGVAVDLSVGVELLKGLHVIKFEAKEAIQEKLTTFSVSEESTLSVMKFEYGTDEYRMHSEGGRVVISGRNGRKYNILGQIIE